MIIKMFLNCLLQLNNVSTCMHVSHPLGGGGGWESGISWGLVVRQVFRWRKVKTT